MPILLYCVAKRGIVASESMTGVAGTSVLREASSQLEIFLSRAEDPAVWLQRELRTAALEFHQVLRQIFKSAAIVPFRFPMIFENDHDLSKHLQEGLSGYGSLLEKFSRLVQMEIRVRGSRSYGLAESGTAYLKARQQSVLAAEEFVNGSKEALSSFVQQWRQNPTRDGVGVVALVDRDAIPTFERVLRNLPVSDEVGVRVSGPWPPTEFMEQSGCAKI